MGQPPSRSAFLFTRSNFSHFAPRCPLPSSIAPRTQITAAQVAAPEVASGGGFVALAMVVEDPPRRYAKLIVQPWRVLASP